MKCCICGQEIKGWSNNALPLMDGQCCSNCNNLVVNARIILDLYNRKPTELVELLKHKEQDIHVGAKVLVIEMVGENNYTGKWGTIEHIDSMGQLHGTWGGCALIPNEDAFIILEES